MAKVLKFYVDCAGVVPINPNGPAYEEPMPEDWETMSEEEREEYAKEVFHGNFTWSWIAEEEER